MRSWSANAWIIVLCIAVFVIDGFLPLRLVSTSGIIPNDPTINVPDEVVIPAWSNAADQLMLHAVAELQVIDPSSGNVIGTVRVQQMRLLESFLHFSTARGFLRVEFWRIIGFQFLHFNLTHLLFNMIGLFFFGSLVERYLGSKRYLAFYLLAGICGALLYLLLNLGGLVTQQMAPGVSIPGMLVNSPWTPLIGASGGVFGVLMAGAYLAPNATVLLFFIIPMRLKVLAYALLAIALFTILTAGANAGGEAAHIGGAVAGFYFIRNPQHLHGFFDILGRIDPTSHHYRKGGARRPGTSRSPTSRKADPRQKQIDAILDKISREGIHSLTEREKRLLREASD